VYPIYSIQNMYVALGGDLGTAALNNFDFDSDDGTVSVHLDTKAASTHKGSPSMRCAIPRLASSTSLRLRPMPPRTPTGSRRRVRGFVQALASLNPSQTYSSGIWVDGALAYNLGASYNVLVVDRATMVNESLHERSRSWEARPLKPK